MSVFRKEYKQLDQETIKRIDEIKTKGEELASLFGYKEIDSRMANRELSLAMTRLEEAVMWAVKGLTT